MPVICRAFVSSIQTEVLLTKSSHAKMLASVLRNVNDAAWVL